MPEYKLTYFNLKGLGEGIRYLLAYSGKKFTDNRIEVKDWSTIKPTTPFGKLPVLEIDGKQYHQSTAILRYLAIDAGLNGGNTLENLQIDQIAGAVLDLAGAVGKIWALEGQAKEDYQKTLLDETIPYYFDNFEKILKDNNGYLANGKLSWADLLLVGYSDTMTFLTGSKDLHGKYPQFEALYKKVNTLPGIKEWVEKRPATF